MATTSPTTTSRSPGVIVAGIEVSCHTWSVRLSDKVSQFESRAPPPQPTRRGPGRRSRSSQRSAIFSRMRVQRSALACFDLARPNASISRLIAESSSSIWTSSSPSCVNSSVSQDGIRSGSITRLGIGRHPAPHLGRRRSMRAEASDAKRIATFRVHAVRYCTRWCFFLRRQAGP